MLNLPLIREQPEEVRRALARRHSEELLDELLSVDIQWRQTLQEVESLRAERNTISKEIGELSRLARTGETREAKHAERRRTDLVARSGFLGERLQALEEQLRETDERLRSLLLELPNLPAEDVPDGPDESANIVVRQVGTPSDIDFEPKPHWDLGEGLGIVDFETAAKLSGSRFFILRGDGARLERALASFMLDIQQSHGYTEMHLPYMVKEETMQGSGQLPKFADNLYHDAEEDYWFIPTAEVPLTNLHRDEVIDPGTLPLSYVAFTPCFRREKVSAGRDVRGMKRVHQFDKVELYKLVEPEKSEAALREMVSHASAIPEALGIPYRVVELCTGDLGFSAAKSFDIEMWAPGSGEWLEVSSCSNCTDFQARRSNIRFRREKGARPEHPHTLNGSGLALPRTFIAVIENYQQRDGSIQIPDVLRHYMGGQERIARA